MTLAIDIAWARPDPGQVKAKGYSAVIGYLSHDSSKVPSRAYIDACHAAGLDFGFVFEDSATRAAAGGPAGAAHGTFARGLAVGLGIPQGTCLYAAVDFAGTDEATTEAYFRAFAASNPGYATGPYGDFAVVSWGRRIGMPYQWQTVAWSAGQVLDGIHLFQRAQQDFNGAADVDEIRQGAWGQWAHTLAPLPPPGPPGPVVVHPEDNMESRTITVQVRNGHGWVPSPAPVAKIVTAVAQDLAPEVHGAFTRVPAFVGVSSDDPTIPNGELVFGPGGDGPAADGNYGFTVLWLA
jgi:hypothetical protein